MRSDAAQYEHERVEALREQHERRRIKGGVANCLLDVHFPGLAFEMVDGRALPVITGADENE